ncbi:hypothetical protein A9Q99_24310 [Gammaproteobacteria bacterium 45_16_T64]|mgnify:CR=1 FL=1|nr:hypothetical protein A9Q99_24310 [Gammaproteobacteria bacterium 45_16_T64]
MNYYGVRISVICVVDDEVIPEDGYTLDVQVHIVEAKDYEEAFSNALVIGKQQEQTYKNDSGNDVVWRLKEIEYIRKLGVVTGVEISSRFEGYFPDSTLDVQTSFNPENSEPITDDESSTY